MWKVIVLLALLTFGPCDGLFRSLYQRTRVFQPPRGDTGQPLFLTPYIEAGKIREGEFKSPNHGYTLNSLGDFFPFLLSNYSIGCKTHSNIFTCFVPNISDLMLYIVGIL